MKGMKELDNQSKLTVHYYHKDIGSCSQRVYHSQVEPAIEKLKKRPNVSRIRVTL